MGKLYGQAASEFMVIFAMMLLVAAVVLSVAVIWPSFVQSIDRQRADSYWSSTQPFSVHQNVIYPNQMVLEVRNNDQLTLTIRNIYLDDTRLDFYNHTYPFTWGSASSRCSGSSCNMSIKPGGRQLISTANFTTTPENPCVSDGDFLPGDSYAMKLDIIYYATDSSSLENQTGVVELVGSCTPR